MPQVLRDKAFDSTLAFIREPYRFISMRCRDLQSDLFETRLRLRRTICMLGPEAAQLFYDPSKFVRRGAMPLRIQKTLLGQGGVQGLDDEAHRHRKQMFMSLMSPERIEQLAQATAREWQAFARRWQSMDKVVLYDELHELLTRAVCAWAGVPLADSEAKRRARELSALFDYAGSLGPKHWWSRLARRRTERWIETLVTRIRAGHVQPPKESASHVIAFYHDLNGNLLTPHIAAVEIINVIRPTVAVAVYITFIARALHEHPESRARLAAGGERYADLFVQEIRRCYPFFPAVAARVRQDFEWKGYRFARGQRVMLDLYGTNHDVRTWNAPDEFRPERFEQWDGSAFNFIPQGGGDHNVNHRCPGEWIAIALMKVAVEALVKRIKYDIPKQNLRINFSRLPAIPRSRFTICNVREAA